MIRSVLPTLCLLGLLVFCACASSQAPEDPAHAVAGELSHRDIVMLGDFGHGRPYPFRTLIDVLEAWAEAPAGPRPLTLYLERTPAAAERLEVYLRTGDMDALLADELPAFTLEQLEFYEDLHALASGLADPSRLWIRGAEPGDIHDRPDISEAEAIRLYVQERDSLIAGAILEHRRTYPDREILAFYGTAHLEDHKVRKVGVPASYPAAQAEGYYLAHHLKAALGEETVWTVDACCPWRPHGPDGVGQPRDRDVLMAWDDVPAGWLPPTYSLHVDAIAFLHQDRIMGHPLRYLCCRRVVAATRADLEGWIPHESVGVFAAREAGRDRRSLEMIGGDPESPIAAYDGTARLLSPEFASHVDDLMGRAARRDQEAVILLAGLGLRVVDYLKLETDDPATRRRFRLDHRDEVLTLQAIGRFWCGDDEELVWAREYLQEQAGRAFATGGEALAWWRAHFRDVSY